MLRIGVLLLPAFLCVSQAQGAGPAKPIDFSSSERVLGWINGYRHKPEPEHLPVAIQALSRAGAFRDPESSGVYIGFVAGVIGANPEIAGDLIAQSFPMHPEDHWVMVRSIAHSGLPDWKHLLSEHAYRMPTRKVMIAKYIDGSLPTLNDTQAQTPPSTNDKIKRLLTGAKPPIPAVDWKLEASPELLDMLWGRFYATGDYGPILRIVGMLPFSKDNESVDKLTLGAMAKYTLANNSSRNPDLLEMLKRSARQQPEETAKILKQVTDAADTMQLTAIRKEAVLAIEDLRRKGPGSKRDLKNWGTIGEGAIALGCIGAAVSGVGAAVGIPCVVGGAVTSAALKGLASQ
jgi:hypothetical protein